MIELTLYIKNITRCHSPESRETHNHIEKIEAKKITTLSSQERPIIGDIIRYNCTDYIVKQVIRNYKNSLGLVRQPPLAFSYGLVIP